MATDLNLLVKLLLDTADYSQKIGDVEKQTSALTRGMDGLSKVGGMAVGAAFGVAAAGAGALAYGLHQSIGAAQEAQLVQAQLDAVLKSTGGAAGVTRDEVLNLSNALQQSTMFGDEAITSAQSLLLTYTGIGKDVFPQATETILDMSQALGQDLTQSAHLVGKALNDPIQGVSALRRVGVQLSDEQEELIKSFMAVGDQASAQKIILGELETQFGGSAAAAGATFTGQMVKLQNALGDFYEEIGMAVLPVLQEFATALNEWIVRPETQEFIQQLATGIAEFARSVAASLPIAFDWIKRAFGWLDENRGVIVAALAAVGVAIAAFVYTTVIPAAIAMIAATWPVILILLAVAAVAYFLYEAWTNNWGGIRDTLEAAWAKIQPALSALWDWLSTNIPKAIDKLVKFWDGTLYPALVEVYEWMEENLFPLFQAIGEFLGVLFVKYIQIVSAAWRNVLYPAFRNFIDWARQNVIPALKPIADFFAVYFVAAFRNLTTAINWVTDAIRKMTGWLKNVTIPDWLTPGSPTPFEIGLLGIYDAMRKINRGALPEFAGALDMGAGGLNIGAGGGQQVVFQININGAKEEIRTQIAESRQAIMDEIANAFARIENGVMA